MSFQFSYMSLSLSLTLVILDSCTVLLMSTLCLMETLAAEPAFQEGLPLYTLYTGDYTCGPLARLLQDEFPDLSRRLMLVNLERDPRDFRKWKFLNVGVRNCVRHRKAGDKVLALLVKLNTRQRMWQDALDRIHFLRRFEAHTLYLVDAINTGWYGSSDQIQVTISFCFCGSDLNLTCPSSEQDAVLRSTYLADEFQVDDLCHIAFNICISSAQKPGIH